MWTTNSRHPAVQDMLEQLLENERQLRQAAEQRAAAYNALLRDLALRLAVERLEEMRRRNPGAVLSVEEWREVFADVLRGGVRSTWSVTVDGNGHGNAHRIAELERALEAARREAAQWREKYMALEQAREGLSSDRPETTSESSKPSPAGKCVLPSAPDLPRLPDMPPPGFRELEHGWPRTALLVAIMATTGRVVRVELAELLVAAMHRAGDTGVKSPQSGSIKRLFARLEKAGVIESEKYTVGQVAIVLARLTPKGKKLASAMGLEAVEDEWERLMRLHGGEAQQDHAAACLAFAYNARQRGYTVTLMPEVEGSAEPDVFIEKDEERLYVEVEAGSGEPERRMRKWQLIHELQGHIAICAPSESIRRTLVDEARKVGPGCATDFAFLRGNPQSMWAETW